MINPDQFYQSRKGEWQQLSDLLDRCRGDVRRLTPEEVSLLGRSYRAATSDLALARRDFPSHPISSYLNQLVARAHAVIYRGEPLAWRRIWRFATTGFPRVYRRTFPFTVVAAASFLLPALLALTATYLRPDASDWLLPAQVHRLRASIEQQELWTNIPVEERPYASSFIMTNNIRVSFLAFGLGILGGVVTLWLMILNGLLLGGLSGLTFHYGVGFELWTFVIGHGVIELSVIFMAGGAGLMLGWSVLQPGLLRRRDALAQAGRRAVRLMIASVPLLVVAGAIEGFISPNEALHWSVKWIVGISSGILLYAYLFLAGRRQPGPDGLEHRFGL